MREMFCPGCGLRQPTDHRFCIACGSRLPVELLIDKPAKAVRFFAGVKVSEGDPEHAWLRVSCYRKDQHLQTAEGVMTIPGHHVRFSVWVDDEARCVLSLPVSEAKELIGFLEGELDDLDDTLVARLPA